MARLAGRCGGPVCGVHSRWAAGHADRGWKRAISRFLMAGGPWPRHPAGNATCPAADVIPRTPGHAGQRSREGVLLLRRRPANPGNFSLCASPVDIAVAVFADRTAGTGKLPFWPLRCIDHRPDHNGIFGRDARAGCRCLCRTPPRIVAESPVRSILPQRAAADIVSSGRGAQAATAVHAGTGQPGSNATVDCRSFRRCSPPSG